MYMSSLSLTLYATHLCSTFHPKDQKTFNKLYAYHSTEVQPPLGCSLAATWENMHYFCPISGQKHTVMTSTMGSLMPVQSRSCVTINCMVFTLPTWKMSATLSGFKPLVPGNAGIPKLMLTAVSYSSCKHIWTFCFLGQSIRKNDLCSKPTMDALSDINISSKLDIGKPPKMMVLTSFCIVEVYKLFPFVMSQKAQDGSF